jgi:hypothetical protein
VTRGKIEHQAFSFVESAQKFQPIEQQKYFHCGMGNTLIAIDEGVIQRHGKAEGGRLVDDGWVQVCSAERGARLRQGGFEAAEIPNPVAPPV